MHKQLSYIFLALHYQHEPTFTKFTHAHGYNNFVIYHLSKGTNFRQLNTADIVDEILSQLMIVSTWHDKYIVLKSVILICIWYEIIYNSLKVANKVKHVSLILAEQD